MLNTPIQVNENKTCEISVINFGMEINVFWTLVHVKVKLIICPLFSLSSWNTYPNHARKDRQL